jgi:hypothetical protein
VFVVIRDFEEHRELAQRVVESTTGESQRGPPLRPPVTGMSYPASGGWNWRLDGKSLIQWVRREQWSFYQEFGSWILGVDVLT